MRRRERREVGRGIEGGKVGVVREALRCRISLLNVKEGQPGCLGSGSNGMEVEGEGR